MPQKFSPSTGCFYPDAIAYSALPTDLIEASDAQFAAAMARGPQDTLAVENGVVVVVPYAGLTLPQAQSIQIAALNNSYQAAITAPVTYKTAAGTTAIFPQSDQPKQYLAQCIEAGEAAWSLNLWLDVNNTPVTPFTFVDLQSLADAMEAAEVPEYQDLLTKVAAVTAATTVAAVQAITF